MIQLPKEKRIGDGLTTADWNGMVNVLRQILPVPSPDILPHSGFGGTWYQLQSRRIPKTESVFEPFRVFTSLGDSSTARANAGVVNGLLPSNWNTNLAIAGAGTEYFVLDVGTNGKQVNAASYSVDASPPAPPGAVDGSAPTAFSVLLAVIVNGVPYQVWEYHNMLCKVIESIRIARNEPHPGGPAWNIWYSWAVVSAIEEP